MNEPMITVLMPAYNAGKYIADAIRSVLTQSFTDFELLIVDDGSSDDTVTVINSFTDERIVLMHQSHGGVSRALNTGLQQARGKYVARFDADDICYEHRLHRQFNFLETHPEYVVVGSDADYILENGEHLFHFNCIAHSHEEISDKLYFYCPFIHSGVMYRKEPVQKAGGYSLHAHNFEDYFLWIQLAGHGKFCNLPEALIRVRFNPASVTIDERWRGARFRKLKRNAIHCGIISQHEGDEIRSILLKQDVSRIKQGAYYALCAKKFLTDNYQPQRARSFAVNAFRINPLRLDNYGLWIVSYFPQTFIQWLHHKTPNKL
jgi:glycosyltransferase involved in cell wall biosynthesis